LGHGVTPGCRLAQAGSGVLITARLGVGWVARPALRSVPVASPLCVALVHSPPPPPLPGRIHGSSIRCCIRSWRPASAQETGQIPMGPAMHRPGQGRALGPCGLPQRPTALAQLKNIDGALRTCHSRVQHCIARAEQARRAGVHVMSEVLGAFKRALRDADLEKYEEYLRRHPGPHAETGGCARSADRHSPVRAEGGIRTLGSAQPL
jgi:hypothetical protein